LLGPQQLGQKQGEVFLGRDYGHTANYSDAVAAKIDDEVRRLIDEAHNQARSILATHRKVLDKLAAALIERETLDTPELMTIIGGVPEWRPAANGARSLANGKAAGRASTPRTSRRRTTRS